MFKENYGPDLLRKIIYAGAHSSTSFEEAEKNLKVIGEIYISYSHIQRLTNRIGREFVAEETEAVELWTDAEATDDNKIEVASVSVDGGRAQTRQENRGVGVCNPRWVETKVSCLQVLESEEKTEDPHPLLPTIFKDKEAVKKLVNGLKGKNKESTGKDKKGNKKSKIDLGHCSREQKKEKRYGPKVVKKIVVATIDKAEDFGNLVSYRARQLQLHTAKRKAYLGDGDLKIWTIYEDCFRLDGWTPVLDFVHAVEYAFEAAKLSTKGELRCWTKYIKYLVHIWQGRVLTVIRGLDKSIKELNRANKKKSVTIEKKIKKLTSIKNYFRNNYSRMDYPEYRKKGLPISSCHVESLIKQINIRVKSTEKFWNRSSLKGILKVKASLLSNDNSWQDFWDNRYEHQVKAKRSYQKMVA